MFRTFDADLRYPFLRAYAGERTSLESLEKEKKLCISQQDVGEDESHYASTTNYVAVDFAAEAPALSSSRIESCHNAQPLAQDILVDSVLC